MKGKKYPWVTDGPQTAGCPASPAVGHVSSPERSVLRPVGSTRPSRLRPQLGERCPAHFQPRLPQCLLLTVQGPSGHQCWLCLELVSPRDLRCMKHYAHASQPFSSCWKSGKLPFQRAFVILNATPFHTYKWRSCKEESDLTLSHTYKVLREEPGNALPHT